MRNYHPKVRYIYVPYESNYKTDYVERELPYIVSRKWYLCMGRVMIKELSKWFRLIITYEPQQISNLENKKSEICEKMEKF